MTAATTIVKLYRHAQVSIDVCPSTILRLLNMAADMVDLVEVFTLSAIDSAGRSYTLRVDTTMPGSAWLNTSTRLDSVHAYGDIEDLRRWFSKRFGQSAAIARLTARADTWPTDRQQLIAEKVKWVGYNESPDEE